MKTTSKVKMTQNEEDIKDGGNLKKDDKFTNEDDLKNVKDPKNDWIHPQK